MSPGRILSKYLHAIQCSSVPVRSGVRLVRQRLHVIDEQTTARRLKTHHKEAGADLQHAWEDAAEVDRDDAQTVVDAEQDSDFRMIR